MVGKKYTIEDLKTIIGPIARKYGVKGIYLFGPYARGDANENSDVDLRIDKGSLKGLFALCGYIQKLRKLAYKSGYSDNGSQEDDFS